MGKLQVMSSADSWDHATTPIVSPGKWADHNSTRLSALLPFCNGRYGRLREVTELDAWRVWNGRKASIFESGNDTKDK